ncbi:hypothetical protein LSH36_67g05000 [Paralvinella palmiformis]|uniref:Carbohydrate sulfotransferase n=1 Tax=Paralvinella palmiformis TaxID=53620 RepID=A0AAD9K3J7_9ANNE|nr:hypothetical protein LSH36_67g05000 [Paralvinella palmiformis]
MITTNRATVSSFLLTRASVRLGWIRIIRLYSRLRWKASHSTDYVYFMMPRLMSHLRTIIIGFLLLSITMLMLRVRYNQLKYSPVKFELEVITEPPIILHTCNQDLRRELVREVCRQAKKENSPTGLRTEHKLKIMVTDDEKKILYCVMAKTGTKSWLHYLVQLAGKVGPGKWHFRKPEFMNRAGLNYLRNVDVEKIRTKYKNYFKFIVARHPFQRLASAYYEAILKAGHFAKKDGSAPNFTDFSSRLDDDLFPQLHWSLYQDECQICHVDYDFVVKTETVEDDSRNMNEAIGSDVNLTVRHTNILYEDPHVDPFKYDHMYHEMEAISPETLKKVLKVYDMDMRTLGYQWDFDEHRSKCENRDDKGGVCC